MPTVAGRRESSGWAVFIKDGDRVIVLETVRARQFAADIVDVCDVIDGCHASGAPGADQVAAKPYDPGKPAPGSHEAIIDRALLMSVESGLPPRHRDGGTDDQEPVPC